MQDDDWNALWLPDRSVVKADLRKRLPVWKRKSRAIQ